MNRRSLISLSFCFLIFSNLPVFSQNSSKNILYREDFNDNSLNWPAGERGSSSIITLANGHYSFEYVGNGTGWCAINSLPVTFPSEFSIEISIRKLYGIEAGYGLVFGGSDVSNIHMFTITSNGYYRCAYFENSEFHDETGWKQNSNIKGVKEENILRIDAKGNWVKYYVNDQLVDQTEVKNFYGDKLGIIIYQKQKIDIDYIQVSSPASVISQAPSVAMNRSEPSATETKPSDTNTNAEKSNPESTYKKTALVIGNSSYANAPLRNPVNDAKAIAAELKELGFNVLLYVDADRVKMREAIRKFGDELLANRGVGLFYYAGHGLQANGINYLVPVNADINREYEIEDQCVQADNILRMMEEYRNPMNVIIMDACRNNPYSRSFRDLEQGLAQPAVAPTGSIIAFATAPGKTASDGTEGHGLYTQELIKAMKQPGNSIEEVFKQVRINVSKESNGDQVPWENSSLMGDFYFIK